MMEHRCLISIFELFLLIDKSQFSAAYMCPNIHGFIYSDNLHFSLHIAGIFYRSPRILLEWIVCCQK